MDGNTSRQHALGTSLIRQNKAYPTSNSVAWVVWQRRLPMATQLRVDPLGDEREQPAWKAGTYKNAGRPL